MKMQVEMFGTQLATFAMNFEDYWKYKQGVDKERYPDELTFKEWLIRFLFFIELVKLMT